MHMLKIEEQKLARLATSAEENAKLKVEKVKNELYGTLKGLETQQSELNRGAMLVETLAEDIDKVQYDYHTIIM